MEHLEEEEESYSSSVESERALAASLFQAASKGDVEELLRVTKDLEGLPGYKDANGRSALHFAASHADGPTCRALLQIAGDESKEFVAMLDKNGDSALRLAVRQGKMDVVHVLRDLDGDRSFLQDAVMSDSLSVVQFVLKEWNGADSINERAPDSGRTVLFTSNSADITAKLIEFGADFDASDKDGLTPLLVAIAKSLKDVCTVLLQSGASLELKFSENFSTVAHLAAEAGDEEFLDILMQMRPDDARKVIRTEIQEKDAIMTAAFHGHVALADALARFVSMNAAETETQIEAMLEERKKDLERMRMAKMELLSKMKERQTNGRQALEGGDIATSIVEFSAAILELDSNLSESEESREILSSLLCDRAIVYLKQNELQSARTDALKALKLNQESEAALRIVQMLNERECNADAGHDIEIPIEIPECADSNAALRSLTLKFKTSDDPEETASKFINENNLHGSLLQRIAQIVSHFQKETTNR